MGIIENVCKCVLCACFCCYIKMVKDLIITFCKCVRNILQWCFTKGSSEEDEQLQSILWTEEGHSDTQRFLQRSPVVVGIFSRDSEESYRWLTDHLTEVFETKTFYISNRGEWKHTKDFYECTFAILYHTKNRGRVNITDVPDSLYDGELKYLSTELGKKNVTVVIDDLEHSGFEAKKNILRSQPSIMHLANELFLFSVEEKQSLLYDGPIMNKLADMRQSIES